MLAYTYVSPGRFELMEKPRPTLQDSRDAIVRVTLASICSSDLHIRRGSVPRAVPGITVGHEMVGVVEETGSRVTRVKPGDRVTVNVETFCGTCYFCRHGWVNNCTDPNGGWALGCRIDGGQAEYVRVPYADQGLDRIPSSVTDEQALLVGDVLATGYWAAQIGNIGPEDTVLIIGAGPTGLCTLQCVLLKHPRRVIVCDADPCAWPSCAATTRRCSPRRLNRWKPLCVSIPTMAERTRCWRWPARRIPSAWHGPVPGPTPP